MRSGRSRLLGAVLAAAAFVAPLSIASSVDAAPAAASKTITIGAVNFTENLILADIYADVLTGAGYTVTQQNPGGTRAVVESALAHGQVDLYPEYAGSLLLYFNPKAGKTANTITSAIAADKTYLAKVGATALAPAPAIDTNVFAVTRATATKYHLKTLSNLKAVASKLVLGGPPECPQNVGCELGLESLYGLHFKSFKSLDEAGPLSVAALKDGTVQVVEFFSSDGNILRNHFVQLADNKHLEPADHIVPVIRKSVDAPGVTAALDAVSAKLTTTQLAQLNIEATFDHEDPKSVAKAWVAKEKLK